MDTHFQEYTQKYEYASKVIMNFLDIEDMIASNTDVKMFDEGSFCHTFFCFSLTNILDQRIQKSLDQMLDRQESDTRPFNPVRTRLHCLYERLAIALGNDFMRDMQTNLIQSLLQLNGVDMENKREVRPAERKIKKIFQKYPEIVLIPIGMPLFVKLKLTQTQHSQMKSISGKVL